MSTETTSLTSATVHAAKPRRRAPRVIAALAAVAAISWTSWHVLHRGQEATDDAQVEGRVMSVSARVPGQVLHVRVVDNQRVSAGEILVELDPADYAARVEVAKADLGAARAAADAARATLALTERTAPAALAQAEGGMTTAAATLQSARASISQARSDAKAAQARADLAALELRRTTRLVGDHAIPQAELDARQAEADSTVAAVAAAEARIEAAQASATGSTGGIAFATGRLSAARTTEQQLASAHAAVTLADAHAQQAEAALHLAELSLSYTTVRAPRAGVVSRRTVEEGQVVSPDRPLLAIVPHDDLWIVANFKEDQLAEMRPGQSADVRFDTFGRRDFAGHVESLAGATGARFALLPPDNATGNYIKVVQRVPVLIRLDSKTDVELRPGMSAEITVHTGQP
jgi:membrane fusion protein (multidrug efflux system)